MEKLEEQLEFDFMEGNREEDIAGEREAKYSAIGFAGFISLISAVGFISNYSTMIDMFRNYFNF